MMALPLLLAASTRGLSVGTSTLRVDEEPEVVADPPDIAGDGHGLGLAVFHAHEMSTDPLYKANVELSSVSSSGLRLGPILVVYASYLGSAPQRTLDQVKTMVYGTPGFADAFNESSWGETGVS